MEGIAVEAMNPTVQSGGHRHHPWGFLMLIACALAIVYLACWIAARVYVDREVDAYQSAERVWVASEGAVNDTNRLLERLPSDLRGQAQTETVVPFPGGRTGNAYLKSPYRSPFIWVLIRDAWTVRHERDMVISAALQNLDHNTSQYDALNMG